MVKTSIENLKLIRVASAQILYAGTQVVRELASTANRLARQPGANFSGYGSSATTTDNSSNMKHSS